ncbi:CRISPR-associated Cas5t family protein [Streptomyces sp. CEV 2-1]|uniref:CRISPR-associated protein Cas5 n=1 Tax=Streptomyces sp. CEV 2-1 TaxID=2485153 RepID=UPI000F477774|nr:CRISPR-associated protein Cas5 [Streptomyces sp. CEV 2-1]ROQ65317.1 CRISPR-associated Cas5t family protein [Streptomyces sp. CEV 2-1]
MTHALEIVVTAPIVSFRNPLYAGLQVGLPCPPPSTVGGLLAAAAGGWERVPEHTRFAMTFHAAGAGTDLETYHPLGSPGTSTNITIKDRDFLALTTLTLWLVEDTDLWEQALRRPVWPLRLGRSQDLVNARARQVELLPQPGRQGHAVVPDDLPGAAGTRMRLTTAIAPDRSRTRWNGYRYSPPGAAAKVDTGLSTAAGQAVALLPPVHPSQFAAVS